MRTYIFHINKSLMSCIMSWIKQSTITTFNAYNDKDFQRLIHHLHLFSSTIHI